MARSSTTTGVSASWTVGRLVGVELGEKLGYRVGILGVGGSLGRLVFREPGRLGCLGRVGVGVGSKSLLIVNIG